MKLTAAVLTLLLAGCGDGGSPAAPRDVTLGDGGSTAAPQHERHPVEQSQQSAAAGRPQAPKPHAAPRRPPIVERPVPFDSKRVEETAAYSRRHYGHSTSRLDPKVIVEHYTVTPTADGVFALFSKDTPDVELHELPGVCSHFLIDRDGRIYQFVPVRQICRHTVGLNDVAIGIEHVGASDGEVIANRAQLSASLQLTSWLRCRYRIDVGNVIDHAESLSSPYHHERVAAVKSQTHEDFQRAAMEQYRARLAKLAC